MNLSNRILAFAGSLRTGSLNKRLVRIAAAGAAEAGAEVTVIDLKDYPVPLYDQDVEDTEGLPEPARRLKALLFEHAGLIIATPEYNSGITAVLKNTIDWTSRAEGDETPTAAWRGRVAALLSASPSGFGGMRGLYHTRSVLLNIGVHVLPQHQFVSRATQAFDEAGNLTDAAAQAAVQQLGADVAAYLASAAR